MKKIAFIALIAITFVACTATKKAVVTAPVPSTPTTVKPFKTIDVYAFDSNNPLSLLLPNTQLKIKNANKEEKTFQLTRLVKDQNTEALVYLPQEVYDMLDHLFKNDQSESPQRKVGDTVRGFRLSAQSLGNGSIFTKSEMESLPTNERRVAEAYQATEKFIVWDMGLTPATGFITKGNKIIPEGTTPPPAYKGAAKNTNTTETVGERLNKMLGN